MAIETLPIDEVLKRMQKERSQLSLIIDEYGGTAGLVTIEDILEEIVGDIHDEFDADEIAEITRISEDHYIVSGKVLIEEINHLLGTSLKKGNCGYDWWMVLVPELRSRRRRRD